MLRFHVQQISITTVQLPTNKTIGCKDGRGWEEGVLPLLLLPEALLAKQTNKQSSMESKTRNLLSAKLLYTKLTQPGAEDCVPTHGRGGEGW